MKTCEVCGKLGRFKRAECSPCYWAENKPRKPSTSAQREKWRAYAKARYDRIQQEARA